MSQEEQKNKKHYKKVSKGGDLVNYDMQDEVILAHPLEVKVYNNNFDKALRAFRALVQKERILSLYKEKQAYEKPSQKRRRKKNEMRRKYLENNNDFSQRKSREYSEHSKDV